MRVYKDQKGAILLPILVAMGLMSVVVFTSFDVTSTLLRSQSELSRSTATQANLSQALRTLAVESTAPGGGDNVEDPPTPNTTAGTPAFPTAPTGGTVGFIPDSSGAPKTDGFGTRLAYCVWDRTDVTTEAADPIVSLIAAGENRQFDTSCDDSTDVNTVAADDTVIWANVATFDEEPLLNEVVVCAAGEALTWDGNAWSCINPNAGGGSADNWTNARNFTINLSGGSGDTQTVDGSSDVTWTLTEGDPEVSSSTTDHVPHWNGSTLVDGSLRDNGTVVTADNDFSVAGETNLNGMTRANYRLEVADRARFQDNVLLSNSSKLGASTGIGISYLQFLGPSGVELHSESSMDIMIDSDYPGNDELNILTHDGTNPVHLFSFTDTGYFGNMPAPSYPIDISGTVNATDFIGNGGQITNISNIRDLEIYSGISPTDGQALIWDNANSRWTAGDSFDQTQGDARYVEQGGDTMTGPLAFNLSTTGQELQLNGVGYGIGAQTSNLYFRSNGGWQWYAGGTHSSTAGDAGTGGTTSMSLSNAGSLSLASSLSVNGGALSINQNWEPQSTFQTMTYGGATNVASIELDNAAGINLLSIDHNAADGGYVGFKVSGHVESSGAYFSDNVGILTNNPQEALEVSGNIKLTGSTIYSSDLNLKKNVSPIGDPLGRLELIEGVGFDWKDESRNDRRYYGVIAQDVEKAMPNAVVTGGDGFKGVDANAMIGLLTASVNELHAKVRELEAKVAKDPR